MRLAVVEHDPSQVGLIACWLAADGHEVSGFAELGDVASACERDSFDALVLDCSPADANGLPLVRQLRDDIRSTIPVVICSACCDEVHVAAALRAGADDYVIKPLRPALLLARLEAVARRRISEAAATAQFEVGEFRVDTRERTLERANVPVRLTGRDFELAVLFLRNVGQLLDRSYIHDVVWKARPIVGSRALDTRVSHVRTRLNLFPAQGWRLAAVYGFGYRLQRLHAPEVSAARPIFATTGAAALGAAYRESAA